MPMFQSIAMAAILLFGLIVLVPLALCLVYSIGSLGSIGPWVPAWGIATLGCAPSAAYLPVARHAPGAGKRMVVAAASVLVAVPAAVLSANTLMVLSYRFGLYDYSQMQAWPFVQADTAARLGLTRP